MPEDIRDAFFNHICEQAEHDPNIIILTDDMDVFSLRQFQKNHPDRFINPGVAEQQIINMAAGLASTGKRVIVCGIASFVTYRCYEQIRINLGSMHLPVAIVGIGVGLSFAFDGPTHHGVHDISVMRSIPEIEIYNPCDCKTAKKCAEIACNSEGPVYIRLDKGVLPDIYKQFYTNVGHYEIYVKNKFNIISTGIATHLVQKVIHPSEAGLFDVFKLKPFDDSLLQDIQAASGVIVIEEHARNGGLGSIVMEALAKNAITLPTRQIALDDGQYLEYGTREWLQEQHGLSCQTIRQTFDEFKKEIA